MEPNLDIRQWLCENFTLDESWETLLAETLVELPFVTTEASIPPTELLKLFVLHGFEWDESLEGQHFWSFVYDLLDDDDCSFLWFPVSMLDVPP
jgi:hypothetical protein